MAATGGGGAAGGNVIERNIPKRKIKYIELNEVAKNLEKEISKNLTAYAVPPGVELMSYLEEIMSLISEYTEIFKKECADDIPIPGTDKFMSEFLNYAFNQAYKMITFLSTKKSDTNYEPLYADLNRIITNLNKKLDLSIHTCHAIKKDHRTAAFLEKFKRKLKEIHGRKFSVSPVVLLQVSIQQVLRSLNDIAREIAELDPDMPSSSKGVPILAVLSSHIQTLSAIYDSIKPTIISQKYAEFVNENRELLVTIHEIKRSVGYIARISKRDYMNVTENGDNINSRNLQSVNTQHFRWFEFDERMKAIERILAAGKNVSLKKKQDVLSPIIKEFRDFVFLTHPSVLIYEEPLYIWLDKLYDRMGEMSDEELMKQTKLLYSYMGQVNTINTHKTLTLMRGGGRSKNRKLTRGWRRRGGDRRVTRRLR